MKLFLVALSASVLAGQLVYAGFNLAGWISLMGPNVLMHVDAFIWFIACLAVTSSMLGVLLRTLLQRADRAALHTLEQRIAQLEARPRG
jgi:hypothetical protein